MARKLPEITPDNEAFWRGGEVGALNIHHCAGCGRFFHPPAPVCPNCLSLDVAPRAVSGRGTVLTFTVNYQAWTPEIDAPFVIAIVELEEQPGLRFLTNVGGCPVEEVCIGMEVRVRFEQHEDVWLPVFERDA